MEDEAPHRRRNSHRLSISETICESVAHAAQDLDMRAIAVYTETGTTARLISKYRPDAEIYSLTYVPEVCNRANLLWGVQPILCAHTPSVDDMVTGAERELVRRGYVEVNDVIGIVAGTRSSSGSTNFMRLHTIGGSLDGTGAVSSAKQAKRKSANGKRGSSNGSKPAGSRKAAAAKR